MANNRLWIFNRETNERVLIAKNFGTWSECVIGDLGGLLTDAAFNGQSVELRIEEDFFDGSIVGIEELPADTTIRIQQKEAD